MILDTLQYSLTANDLVTFAGVASYSFRSLPADGSYTVCVTAEAISAGETNSNIIAGVIQNKTRNGFDICFSVNAGSVGDIVLFNIMVVE